MQSRNKSSEINTSTAELKSCAGCGVQKQIGDFYQKGKRVDATCKDCRRNQRNERYSNSKTAEPLSAKAKVEFHSPAPGPIKAKSLLSAEHIMQLAEAFLLLETWDAEVNTQEDVSNSKADETKLNK